MRPQTRTSGTDTITAARCETYGNADQSRFLRYYIAELRERLVEGRWVGEESYEFDDGAHTSTVCETCEHGPVREGVAPPGGR